MKDKIARELIAELVTKLGFQIHNPDTDKAWVGIDTSADNRYDRLQYQVAKLEQKFDLMDEAAKPNCKTCGQKIQEGGLLAGQVEAVAEAVSGKRTKR